MPRPLRIEFENARYHVMNRGAGRKNIFKTHRQKEFFLKLLAEAHEIFGIEIHAYCLMSNHYHLLLKTPFPNLSRAMQYINAHYTQGFNREMKTDGPLFRGRYKAILVSYDEYFLNVSRYIHLNPIEANIAKNPSCYLWSSCKYYTNKINHPEWLNIENTMELFFNSNDKRLSYKKFLDEGIDIETKKFYEDNHTSVIFTSKDTKNNILKLIEDKKIIDSSADYNRSKIMFTLDQIIFASAKILNVSVDAIVSRKNGKANLPRKIAIYGCRLWSGKTLPIIARQFYCKSASNISDIVREIKSKIKKEEIFRKWVDEIYSELIKFPKTSI